VRHRNSHHLTGVFQAAFDLRDRGLLAHGEGDWLKYLSQWFDRHLPVPRRFSRSRRPHAFANAVCWFRPDADRHLDRVRQLAALLERHGVATHRLRTERPGYVVYEDAFQVAAV